MTSKFLVGIVPRGYQEKIFEKCKEKNTLVVLPTGIGKTLIALMLAIERMEKFPMKKILFLAPTRPLAEQHLIYFQKHLPEIFAQMELFTGKIHANERKKLWEKADIIFSTPQCISNDIKKEVYDLKEVSLLIEDEAHRCVKNYTYTDVAKAYKNQGNNQRILGLTASPGANKEAIKIICSNLFIEDVEIRTRESEDVKPYLQELNFKTIKIEFPKRFQKIRALFNEIYQEKVASLKEKNLLFGPGNKITLLEAQRKMMAQISRGTKNYLLFHGVSTCTQAIKISHAIELLETQTVYGLNRYLEDQISQANANKSRAVKSLVSNPRFTEANHLVKELISENIEHPKILELKDIIDQKTTENSKTKIIIFTQFRDSVSKICEELNTLKNATAKTFVGQTKKAGSGLTQKDQRKTIIEFSNNEFNVLCATSIGEEGLDIPEVNAVIFYEPVPSAIRKIQRTGRTARLFPGELIILITKDTRDEISYWSSIRKEKTMYKALDSIKKDIANNNFQIKSQRTLS